MTPIAPQPPSAVIVQEFTDPTDANSGVELLAVDAVQLQLSPLRARRVVVQLGGSTVVFHASNLRMRTRTAVHRGHLAYVCFGEDTQGSVNGVAVRPDRLLAVAPETEVGFVADAGWQSIAVLLAPESIETHLRARQRMDEYRLPRQVETLQADALALRQLFDWGMRLVETAQADPELFNGSQDERDAAHAELIELLLTALRSSIDSEPARTELTRQAQSRAVKLAEDHAMANIGERVYVSDLCKVAHVSERALEYAFKQVMGLTPVAYLARLRLHRVRDALLNAPPGSATVSEIALLWGFWHFGEFAKAYKDVFDELPSDTLRRRGA
ncbi:helix-turn-helix domain-containing protein [Paucibacter sp. JuS9]|uniref:helix-turn-helix domain-containing protein n=1 Tax=Roseateles TaxID=93681 RepID=UPI002FE5B1D7